MMMMMMMTFVDRYSTGDFKNSVFNCQQQKRDNQGSAPSPWFFGEQPIIYLKRGEKYIKSEINI